jgi:hypothetical protein
MRARAFAVSVVAALLAVSPALAGDTSPFTFHLPAGWTEVSPATLKDEALLKRLPPALAQAAQNVQVRWLAADLDSTATGFTTNVNVVMQEGSGTVTQELVDQLAAQLVQNFGGRKVDARLVTLQGSAVGRVHTERDQEGVKVSLLQFLMPGRGRTAILSCTTTTDRYASQEPVFDKLAATTEGIHAPSLLDGVGSAALTWGLIGAAIGGLGALSKSMSKKS